MSDVYSAEPISVADIVLMKMFAICADFCRVEYADCASGSHCFSLLKVIVHKLSTYIRLDYSVQFVHCQDVFSEVLYVCKTPE